MGTQVGTVQNKIREDFSEATQGKKWLTRKNTAGMIVDWSSQPSGIRIGTGTAVGELVLRYNMPFETPVRAMFSALGTAILSQRIANQEFELRLASDDGTEILSILLDGTSTTTAKQRSSNEGLLATDTTYTIPDTATGSPALELESWIDECYWHARQADSVTPRTNSVVRNRRIPDPHTQLYVEIVARNTAVAASNTYLTLDAVTVQDISEMTAEITGGRGGGAASQAVPVNVITSTGINMSAAAAANAGGQDLTITSAALGAGATFTQSASVDLGTDAQRRLNRSRIDYYATAAALGSIAHLRLEESTDGTTWREAWRCPMPADGLVHSFELPLRTRYRRWSVINGATAQTALFLQERSLNQDGATDIDKNLAIPLTPAAGQALAASATYTSPTFDFGGNHQWDRVRVLVKIDQATAANGVVLQQSLDGTTWAQPAAGGTLAAGNATVIEQGIVGRYFRLAVVNSTTAATGMIASVGLVSL